MDDLKENIEKALITGDSDLISYAVYELDMKYILGESFKEEEVEWVITLIDKSMRNDSRGSNALVNLFQSHWSKMTEPSRKKVKSLCHRHIDNLKNLSTQTAMAEILNGEYLS